MNHVSASFFVTLLCITCKVCLISNPVATGSCLRFLSPSVPVLRCKYSLNTSPTPNTYCLHTAIVPAAWLALWGQEFSVSTKSLTMHSALHFRSIQEMPLRNLKVRTEFCTGFDLNPFHSQALCPWPSQTTIHFCFNHDVAKGLPWAMCDLSSEGFVRRRCALWSLIWRGIPCGEYVDVSECVKCWLRPTEHPGI